MMKYRRSLLGVVWLLALAPWAYAAELAELKPKVEALAQPLVESGTVIGLVIGMNRQGQTGVWGYGKLSEASPRPPDGQTLFEIGSVTKVFTCLALADMVHQKLVRLDEPVGALLPDAVKVPQWDDRKITLLDLATHTSALPRLPQNLLPQVAKHPENPYAAYTVEHLYEALSAGSLARAPGAQYGYSNYGMGLLGHALARRAGLSYEELIRQRICTPLGMTDTRITLAEPLRARLAQGHDVDGRPLPAWDFVALAGAGALRSTADDLLRFLAANLAIRPSPLAPAIELSHQVRHEIAKDSLGIALGWHVNLQDRVYWHNGQTGGYHSFVAFQKERKVGVVVLGNTAGASVDGLGLRVMKLLAGQPVEPMHVRMPIRLDPATLEQYVGKYEALPGFTLEVFRQGDRLLARATGQPSAGIYPASETEFFYRAVDAQITFVKDPDGKITKLILHQHGIDLPAWKGGIAYRLGEGIWKALTGQKKQDKPAKHP